MGLKHLFGLSVLLFPHWKPCHSPSPLFLLYFLHLSFTFQKLGFLTRGIAFTRGIHAKRCPRQPPQLARSKTSALRARRLKQPRVSGSEPSSCQYTSNQWKICLCKGGKKEVREQREGGQREGREKGGEGSYISNLRCTVSWQIQRWRWPCLKDPSKGYL